MSAKTNAEVVIDGKVYTLCGYEEPEYLQRVAAYINSKISEIDTLEGAKSLPANMKSVMIQLNIADDYFKAKERVDNIEKDLENKEKELYELKHELISAQIKAETSEKELKELESQNKELLLHKTKLESALEDALLGEVPADSKTKSVK